MREWLERDCVFSLLSLSPEFCLLACLFVDKQACCYVDDVADDMFYVLNFSLLSTIESGDKSRVGR
jgi:hypothetical protein